MGGRRQKQASDALVRQLTLLFQLMQRERGMTLLELQAVMELPKATFHRYLDAFKLADIPIDRECVNGCTRYCLSPELRMSLAITPEQLDALRVARRSVTALEGSHVTQGLDALIRQAARRSGTYASRVRVRQGKMASPDALKEIERAFASQRRVVIRYRGERDAASRARIVEPLLLRYVNGHVYLHAFDVDRGGTRTFKLDRISSAQCSRERANPHVVDETAFRQSIKAWLGAPTRIAVQLSPRAARIADEYRLVDDQVVDDSGRLSATVNGIPEAMRWVLSWGKDAEALEPKALRDAVAAEIHAAASLYVGAGFKPAQSTPAQPNTARDRAPVGAGFKPALSTTHALAPTKVAAKKTRARRSTSLTDRETAAE